MKLDAVLELTPAPSSGQSAVFDYLEGFYNPRRRHSSLGYRSPMRFEQELINGDARLSHLPLNAADRAAVKAARIQKQDKHRRFTLRP